MYTPYAPLSDETLDSNIASLSGKIALSVQSVQNADSELNERKPQVLVDLEADIARLEDELREKKSKLNAYVGKWKANPDIRELHETLDSSKGELKTLSEQVQLMLTEKRIRYHLNNKEFSPSDVPLGMIELDGQLYHIQTSQVAWGGWYAANFKQARELWDYLVEQNISNMVVFSVDVKANTDVISVSDLNSHMLDLMKSTNPPPISLKGQILRRENKEDVTPFYLRKAE